MDAEKDSQQYKAGLFGYQQIGRAWMLSWNNFD